MPTRMINPNLLLANLRYIEGKADKFISDVYTNFLVSSREVYDFLIIDKETDMLKLEKSVVVFLKKIIILVQEGKYEEANEEVIQLGKRHFQYRVPLEFYPIFQFAFIFTLKQYLGPAWTRQAERDWKMTFFILITLIKKGYGL